MKSAGRLGRYVRNAIMIAVIVVLISAVAHYFGYDVPVLGGYLEGVVPRGN